MKLFRKNLLKFLLLISIGYFTACASEKVATQPTAPAVEEKPSPGPTYLLMGPEWRWDPVQKVYIYVPGQWVVKQNTVWVRGHWKPVKGGWRWVPGHWK